MRRLTWGVFAAAILLLSELGGPGPVHAQDAAGGTVRIATRVLPPLVTQDKGELGGFSIELWREIANRLKVQSAIKVEPDVRSLLSSVRAGTADVGISAISITSERDKEFDFSQPMLDGGLQILVRGGGEAGAATPLRDLLRLLFSKAILQWLGIALLLVIVPAHIIWFLERGKPEGVVPEKEYIPGIFHAMWWAGSTLAAQGDQMPRHWLARVLALLWLFTSVIFIAFYTAQLTAALTVQRIQGDISGPQDLPGKQVATTAGSTAAAYLKEIQAKVTEVASIDAAFKALTDRKVDAVVFDAPIIQHHASHAGKNLTEVVGGVFREEHYGIAFPRNSVWRKRVDGALLSMREDGTYQRLYEKYFAVQ